MMATFATFVTGCATKGYVRNNVSPVQAKVDQVADQANKQGEQLQQTRQDVDKNTTAIAGVDEKATAADRRAGDALNRAGDALNRANTVDQKATQNTQQIASLRNTIINFDNYKVVRTATVLFPLNRATLKTEDKQQLDQLISQTSGLKRYFIAIEGYTDPTGDAAYNLELSKRRADAVVQYLAGERDVDFNRIHTIGLGEQKLVDEAKTRDARAKNRRVEVKVYSADDALTAGGTAGSN
jgi:outer membrane protein OmpA-like peptidoglycan-associated protein